MKSILKNHSLFLLILLIGGFLRLYNFSNLPFSNDELSAISRLNFSNFNDLIQFGVKPDGHPAGIQFFLFYYSKLFGLSEMALKFPFILMGLASIFVAYCLTLKWFSKSAALLVAALLACTQFSIHYSLLIRPYIPGMFFSLCMVYFWSDLIWNFPKNKWLNFFGFIFFASLCTYSHHMSLLFLGIVSIFGLFYLKKQNVYYYLLANIFIFILYIPHLNIFLYQLEIGGLGGPDGWLGRPSANFILIFLGYLFHYSWSFYFLISILFFGSILFFRNKNKDLFKFRLFSIYAFLAQFLICYFYSIFINPVLQFSVLIFSFPFLLIFISSFIKELKPLYNIVMVGVVLIISISTLIVNRNHFMLAYKLPISENVRLTKQAIDSLGKENLSIYIDGNPIYYAYYLKKYNVQFNYKTIGNIDQFNDFEKEIAENKCEYVILANPNIMLVPIVQRYFPYLIKRQYGFLHSFYLFSKKDNGRTIKDSLFFILKNNFEILRDSLFMENSKILNDPLKARNRVIKLDSTVEFGPSKDLELYKWIPNNKTVLEISLKVLALDSPVNASLCLSTDGSKGNVDFRAVTMDKFILSKNKWTNVQWRVDLIDLPFVMKEENKMNFFIWNTGRQTFFIDDIKIDARSNNPYWYSTFYK